MPDDPFLRNAEDRPRDGQELKWSKVLPDEVAVKWFKDANGDIMEVVWPQDLSRLTYLQVKGLDQRGNLDYRFAEILAQFPKQIEKLKGKFERISEAISAAIPGLKKNDLYFNEDFNEIFSLVGQEDKTGTFIDGRKKAEEFKVENDGSKVWVLHSRPIEDGQLEIILREFPIGNRRSGQKVKFIRWRRTEGSWKGAVVGEAKPKEETKPTAGSAPSPDLTSLLGRFGRPISKKKK